MASTPCSAAGRACKKFGQVTGDGGIGDVGQAEFAKDALLFLLRLVGKLAGRQKSVRATVQGFRLA